MFRFFGFVGVASAAIIESRPHEHLQIVNSQLQNATDAVIKTAAVAGLAYAGAYMAGLEAGVGSSASSYDSSRKSQAASTGAKYCDTRERNPLKFQCSAKHWNGKHVYQNNNAANNDQGAKVGIRNYWCCAAPDLGAQYEGNLDGVCTNYNWASQGWAQRVGGSAGFVSGLTTTANVGAPTTCVYHGPCLGGRADDDPPASTSTDTNAIAILQSNSAKSGSCTSRNFLQPLQQNEIMSALTWGVPGGTPPGQVLQRLTAEDLSAEKSLDTTANNPPTTVTDVGYTGVTETSVAGASFGPAMWGMEAAQNCCIKFEDGQSDLQDSQWKGSAGQDLSDNFNDPSILEFQQSFCVVGNTCPDGYGLQAKHFGEVHTTTDQTQPVSP